MEGCRRARARMWPCKEPCRRCGRSQRIVIPTTGRLSSSLEIGGRVSIRGNAMYIQFLQKGGGGMRAQRVVSLVTLLLCIFLQATSGAITDGPQGVQARVIPEPQGRPKMVAQLGHTYGVTGVAFSPRAGLLASGSFDKTIKIWEVV